MTDFSEKLSAYLDGELEAADTEAVETRLASDPQAQAELDALIRADALAQDAFDAQLNAPIPFTLAQQIKSTRMPEQPARPNRTIRGALAASLVFFVLGGLGGYALKQQTSPIQTTGWLADIANYHEVYARQGRHLVEVGADEADHIEAWLGKTIGATFTIPDLSGFELTFEGGRLLVANGKPVAQLMYTQKDGTVVALCMQGSQNVGDDQATFKEQVINGFEFVSWSAGNANYVVIGPKDQPDLKAIAATAALEI